jgi:hypothetical protein
LGRQFIQEYVNQFDIREDKVHLGIAQFAGTDEASRVEINITSNVLAINKTIESMKQIGGSTPMLKGGVVIDEKFTFRC